MDNAFFVREQRQFARRRPVAWRWVGGTLFVMAAIIVALMIWVPSGTIGRFPLAAWSLIAPHAFLCWVAAGYGMNRTMAAEAQIGTLEGVLLLPYTPLRWWLLKSVFAAALVVVAWCIPLPLYLMATLSGLLDSAGMVSVPLTALGAGLVSLPLGILGIADYLPRSERATLRASVAAQTALRAGAVVKVSTAGSAISAQGGEGGILGLLYGAWLLSVAVRGRECLFQSMSFFGLIMPEWYLGLPITLLVAWAIAEQGRALILGRDHYEVRAAWIRFGATLALMLWGLGAFWVRLPKEVRAMSLLSIGFLVVLGTVSSWKRAREAKMLKAVKEKGEKEKEKAVIAAPSVTDALPLEAASEEEGAAPLLTGRALKKREREEARIARDLTWLLSKSENAVWQKDVRAHLRLASLRTMNRTNGILTLIMGVVLYAMWQWLPRGGGGGAFQAPMWIIIGIVSRPSVLGLARWIREARGCTLLLLLTSPLPSREILTGRIAAAFVVGWLGTIPGVLALGGLALWGAWFTLYHAPSRLALFGPALLLTLMVWVPVLVAIQIHSIGNAHRAVPAVKAPFAPRGTFYSLSLLVIGLAAFALMPAIGFHKLSFALGAVAAAVLFALTCLLCVATFRLRVRQLDALRCGDLPFDALRSHALSGPQRRNARKGAKAQSQEQVAA